MSHKTFKLVSSLVVIVAFITGCTNVNTNNDVKSTDSVVKVPVSVYLQIMQSYAPTALCHKLITDSVTSLIMKKAHMNDEKCLPLMTDSVQKCVKSISLKMPKQIDRNEAGKWGGNIGACACADFYTNNLI